MPDQNSNVSPAFANTPANPNIVTPEQVTNNLSSPQAATPPNTQPSPQPVSQPAVQGSVPPVSTPQAEPDLASVLASLSQSDEKQQVVVPPMPSTATPPQPENTQQSNYAQQPPITPEQWQQQQQALQQQQQLQALIQQNNELQQKLQAQDTTINNLLAVQKDYDALKQQSTVNEIDFGELTTVDPADAKKISAGIMKALSGPLAAIQQALQQQQDYMTQSNQWQEQRFTQQQAYDTINRIRVAHPDFLQLQQDPAYLQFVNQRDGHSFQTRDNRAAFEFKNGNADYIIDLLNQFKQQRPQQASITTVAPVQTAGSPVQEAPKPVAMPSLATWNSWYQTHRITQEQYQQGLKKIREQNQG